MAGVPSARSGDRSAGADRDWRLSWERKEHDRRAFSPGPLLGAAVQRRVRQLDQRVPRRRSSWRSGVSAPASPPAHQPSSVQRSAGPGPSSTLTSLWLFRYALPPPPLSARPPGWDGDRWRSVPRRWARFLDLPPQSLRPPGDHLGRRQCPLCDLAAWVTDQAGGSADEQDRSVACLLSVPAGRMVRRGWACGQASDQEPPLRPKARSLLWEDLERSVPPKGRKCYHVSTWVLIPSSICSQFRLNCSACPWSLQLSWVNVMRVRSPSAVSVYTIVW